MKERLLGLLLTMALLLSACGGEAAAPEAPAADPITFTDDLGREVSLPRPRRVAALIGSFAEIWCLAGGRETLAAAADDAWTSFDLNLSPETANLGAIKNINVETLFAAQPDLVLASSNTAADVALLELLEEAGLPAAYFKVAAFEDYLRMLEICTQLTGCPENYEANGASIQAQVDAARARANGSSPTVLYVRATGSSCKVKNSQDSVLGEMLADMGCINIADRADALLEELSLEVILEQDPDYIFAVVQGSDPAKAEALLDTTLLSHPAWQALTAVREGRFHVMDQKLYNLKPNANWGVAYEGLADILYP